ncbi:tetratricopeptide repeat protein [Phormidium sp. LEGE 05292]|uniref:CHAT domain-containing protein n=1 Tax=[Phormidium] sp. LEGE 05292 TaxID=767427 RepID=UPI0018807D9B|nr:tetratricopeptide repeat protein [Phormidium sp. LEGE 05292]MBE9226824.1 tetratricopeptide repeat protein [Phormidium sp. LEGE 05292]
MNRKTSQNKLVFAFLKGVSVSGIILGALLSESVIATSKTSDIGFLLGISNDQPTELKKPVFLPHQNTIIAQNSSNSEADRLLQEGFQLFQQGTAESLRAGLEKWEAARQLYRAAGDKGKEALTLLLIGRINDDLGEKQQALDYYNQALPLTRAVGDRGGEAATLSNIGSVYNSLGEKQRALDYYNQALPLLRAVGDRGGEATTLNNIGSVYNSLGEKQKALDYYNQALPLSRAVGDRGTEAKTLNNIGNMYYSLGEKQQALDYYNQALPLFRAVGDRGGEAATLNNIGSVYYSLGEKQRALDYYNQALPLLRAVGDRGGEAATLNNIGFVYDLLGEKQQALDYYNQALPLRRAVGDRGGEATTLNNIGNVYDSLGEKQQALDYYNQALPLFRAVGDRGGEATTLSNIGTVYNSLGEKQRALDYLNQALSLRRAVGDRGGEATTLNNIGNVYDSLGERQQALDYYNQALPISRVVGDRGVEATTLSNIGTVYDNLGEKQKALDYLNQALSLKRAMGDRGGEATTLNNIGNVYYSLGEKQKALHYLNQALPRLRAVGDRGGVALNLYNFAYLKRSQGNLTEALTDIEAAVTIVEDLRTKIGSQELRQSYFATVQDYYQFYIDLLMQLHQQNPNKGYDGQALYISERARARSLLELLTEATANIRQGVDPKLLEQERNLQQQLNTLENRKYQLQSGQYSEQELNEIKQKINNLLEQLKQLEAQIRINSPRYADLKYPQPLNLQQIQQQVLDDDTLLLQYSLGEDRSFLWAVTKNSITSYVLPKQSEIEAAVKTFRESVTKNNTATLDTGLPLSKILLAPVANQLGNKRLLIVGDGALQFVPFAALPLPNSPTNPLLVQNEIVTLPSASTVAIQRRQLQNRTPVAKTVAVIADPVFSPKDSRITGNSPAPTNNTLSELSLNRAARNLGLGEDGGGRIFDRLKFTRTEADKILAFAPQAQRLQAFDFDASRQTATNPDLAQYQIIHFATHGLLDPVNPELSGIVLSLYDKNGKSEDGFLRLQDIFNLNLPAELVVLSACETGLGENVKGEGLVGLTRGFMYAGARRVVVSLWSVNDAATSELMAKFYQKILQGRENPVQALREAQLEMWNSQDRRSPYYWAAFTVQGDWR